MYATSTLEITLNRQIVKDFLYHCFQKDPNIRVSAKKLLKHPWILATRNENDDSEGTPSPPLPMTTPHEPTRTPSGKTVTLAPPPAHYPSDRDPAKIPASNSGGSDTVRAKKKPSTVYDEAVSRVREWNEALNGMSRSVLVRSELTLQHRLARSTIPSSVDLTMGMLAKPQSTLCARNTPRNDQSPNSS